MPHIGTNTMYSAVIKPALPTVVSFMPSCCSALATASTVPTITPPIISVRRDLASVLGLSSEPVPRLAALIAITGSSAMPAASERRALNAYALMLSPPIAWNTKAVPHMSATSTNNKLLVNCFLFIIGIIAYADSLFYRFHAFSGGWSLFIMNNVV